MKDTSFYVTDKTQQSRIAEPFENDRKIGNGITVGGLWESGGGGMVSTAIDYARFLQMLSDGGTLDGQRILGPKTIAYMTSNHLGSGVVPGLITDPDQVMGLGSVLLCGLTRVSRRCTALRATPIGVVLAERLSGSIQENGCL